MSRSIFFISDTHFNHANILTFKDKKTGALIRPGFSNVEDMNERIIDNWNKVVKPEDKIYHVGDVAFGNVKDFHPIMRRLNGHKRLCLGNHDHFDILDYAQYFDKIMSWRQFRDQPIPFIVCHYPLHEDALFGRGGIIYNVHGHIHERNVYTGKRPDPRYINICVEHTDYTPVHIDELQQRMK